MKTENNKCYAYIRVSTDRQDESKEVQEKRIREYCTFKNLEIIEVLTDENISGFKEIYKRPAGATLEKLNGVKNIVAIKPDRLFRNVKDSLTVVDEWNRLGVALHLVDVDGVSLSTKSAIGRLMFTTVIAFAEFERSITSERVKTILNNKKDTNKVYCAHLLGFDKVDGKLIRNESEQSIIEIIKQHKGELSPAKIADKLNSDGYKAKKGGKFFPSTIAYILKNNINQ